MPASSDVLNNAGNAASGIGSVAGASEHAAASTLSRLGPAGNLLTAANSAYGVHEAATNPNLSPHDANVQAGTAVLGGACSIVGGTLGGAAGGTVGAAAGSAVPVVGTAAGMGAGAATGGYLGSQAGQAACSPLGDTMVGRGVGAAAIATDRTIGAGARAVMQANNEAYEANPDGYLRGMSQF